MMWDLWVTFICRALRSVYKTGNEILGSRFLPLVALKDLLIELLSNANLQGTC